MDKIERKARELMRVRENRNGCNVTPNKNACIYNNYELWKPSSEAFYKLAERVLTEENYG